MATKTAKSRALSILDEDDLTAALKSAFPAKKIVAQLRKLLRSKVGMKIIERDEDGELVELIERVPDWKAIAAAVKFILEYTEGTPIKRTLQVNINTGPQEPLPERLAASPQLRRAVLDAAEIAAESEPGGESRLPVPVEALEVPAEKPDPLASDKPMTAADYLAPAPEKACQSNPDANASVESLIALLDTLPPEANNSAT